MFTLTDQSAWPSASGPVDYDIKVIYASDDSNEVTSASAQAEFTVTVVNACYYNEITCDALADIEFTILADGTSPGSVTQAAVSCTFSGVDNDGNTLTSTECPLT